MWCPYPNANPQTIDRAAVVAVLEDQKTAWNRGDIPAFMNGYWRSPDVTFAGKAGFTRGWDTVLARYQRTYPDQASMGHLEFSELEVRPLGTGAAIILKQRALAQRFVLRLIVHILAASSPEDGNKHKADGQSPLPCPATL